MQPVLSEPSLTLAVSLCESQLAACSSDILLVVAIVNFLAQAASTAKCSLSHSNEESQVYSEDQVSNEGHCDCIAMLSCQCRL